MLTSSVFVWGAVIEATGGLPAILAVAENPKAMARIDFFIEITPKVYNLGTTCHKAIADHFLPFFFTELLRRYVTAFSPKTEMTHLWFASHFVILLDFLRHSKTQSNCTFTKECPEKTNLIFPPSGGGAQALILKLFLRCPNATLPGRSGPQPFRFS